MLTILMLLLVFVSAVACDSDPPVVHTKYGPITGYTDRVSPDGRHFYGFTGVPFAEPPIGTLRFKDPVPLSGLKDGVFMATSPPPLCPQYSFGRSGHRSSLGDMIGQEDCLYLNVFTPKLDVTEPLPVMVYIHGGAFLVGGATLYPPHKFMERDVILVVVQYRLGFLGFLSTEDDEAPGNAGLKDQLEALRWVRDNIGAFGGDPQRVTIFGESAGGASVHLLLITDTEDLFERAIMQSGVSNCFWSIVDNPLSYATTVGQNLNCDSPDTKQLVDCLQDKPVEDIASAHAQFLEWSVMPLVTAPWVDGELLKAHPIELMKNGRHRIVDIMVGYTQHEGAFFSAQFYTSLDMFRKLNEDFEKYSQISLGLTPSNAYKPEMLAKIIYKRYFGQKIDFKQSGDAFTQLMGDRSFKVCTDIMKLLYLNTTSVAAVGVNTYAYEYTHRGRLSYSDAYSFQYLKDIHRVKEWVSHADELFLMFPGFAFSRPSDDENDQKVSDILVELWTNFASSGNPTPDGSPFVWEPMTMDSGKHLNIKVEPSMEEDKYEGKLKFFGEFPLFENIVMDFERFSKFRDGQKEQEMNEVTEKQADVLEETTAETRDEL